MHLSIYESIDWWVFSVPWQLTSGSQAGRYLSPWRTTLMPGRKKSYLVTETGVFSDCYEIKWVSVKRHQSGSFRKKSGQRNRANQTCSASCFFLSSPELEEKLGRSCVPQFATGLTCPYCLATFTWLDPKEISIYRPRWSGQVLCLGRRRPRFAPIQSLFSHLG